MLNELSLYALPNQLYHYATIIWFGCASCFSLWLFSSSFFYHSLSPSCYQDLCVRVCVCVCVYVDGGCLLAMCGRMVIPFIIFRLKYSPFLRFDVVNMGNVTAIKMKLIELVQNGGVLTEWLVSRILMIKYFKLFNSYCHVCPLGIVFLFCIIVVWKQANFAHSH